MNNATVSTSNTAYSNAWTTVSSSSGTSNFTTNDYLYYPYITTASPGYATSNFTYTTTSPIKEEEKPPIKKEKKELKIMDKLFGKISNAKLKYSIYGLAVQNKENKFVAFDTKTNKLIDVSGMTFDFECFYKIPKALKDVAPGDIVYHMGNPIFVYSINENSRIIGLDPTEGEERIIVPSVSPFGFDYVSVIINPLKDNMPTEDSPFGNMLPMLMMSDKNTNLLPFLLMQGDKPIDPMMLMMMMGKDNNNLIEPYLLMMMMKGNNENK